MEEKLTDASKLFEMLIDLQTSWHELALKKSLFYAQFPT